MDSGRAAARRPGMTGERMDDANKRLVALRWIVDLPRIHHHRDGGNVDIDELAVALLDPADVDVLHDLALGRIDPDWAARRRQLLALHEINVLRALGVGPKRRDRLVD